MIYVGFIERENTEDVQVEKEEDDTPNRCILCIQDP